jgi:serine/threonine protein kinase
VIIDKENGKAYLVLEYCPNGFINENKNKYTKSRHTYRKLLESECKKYFKQLALAINYSIFNF